MNGATGSPGQPIIFWELRTRRKEKNAGLKRKNRKRRKRRSCRKRRKGRWFKKRGDKGTEGVEGGVGREDKGGKEDT